MKKTLVLGASPNSGRYSYLATQRLKNAGHDVIPLGLRQGEIDGIPIEIQRKDWKDIDTITMYMNAGRQKEYYDYILNVIKPARIIFNPGAENEELTELANKKGIETIDACTLVMLSIGNY